MHKRILAADDSRTIRQAIQIAFQTESTFALDVVANGQSVLAKLEEQHYDLLLLDYRMPGVNGTELCLRLSQHPNTWDIPVLLLTGQRSDPARWESLPAAGFLEKPFQIDDLLSKVSEMLSASFKPTPKPLYQTKDQERIEATRSSITLDAASGLFPGTSASSRELPASPPQSSATVASTEVVEAVPPHMATDTAHTDVVASVSSSTRSASSQNSAVGARSASLSNTPIANPSEPTSDVPVAKVELLPSDADTMSAAERAQAQHDSHELAPVIPSSAKDDLPYTPPPNKRHSIKNESRELSQALPPSQIYFAVTKPPTGHFDRPPEETKTTTPPESITAPNSAVLDKTPVEAQSSAQVNAFVQAEVEHLSDIAPPESFTPPPVSQQHRSMSSLPELPPPERPEPASQNRLTPPPPQPSTPEQDEKTSTSPGGEAIPVLMGTIVGQVVAEDDEHMDDQTVDQTPATGTPAPGNRPSQTGLELLLPTEEGGGREQAQSTSSAARTQHYQSPTPIDDVIDDDVVSQPPAYGPASTGWQETQSTPAGHHYVPEAPASLRQTNTYFNRQPSQGFQVPRSISESYQMGSSPFSPPSHIPAQATPYPPQQPHSQGSYYPASQDYMEVVEQPTNYQYYSSERLPEMPPTPLSSQYASQQGYMESVNTEPKHLPVSTQSATPQVDADGLLPCPAGHMQLTLGTLLDLHTTSQLLQFVDHAQDRLTVTRQQQRTPLLVTSEHFSGQTVLQFGGSPDEIQLLSPSILSCFASVAETQRHQVIEKLHETLNVDDIDAHKKQSFQLRLATLPYAMSIRQRLALLQYSPLRRFTHHFRMVPMHLYTDPREPHQLEPEPPPQEEQRVILIDNLQQHVTLIALYRLLEINFSLALEQVVPLNQPLDTIFRATLFHFEIRQQLPILLDALKEAYPALQIPRF